MPSLLQRFFRLAFHVATCFSALALVASLILWPRSYHRVDALAGSLGPLSFRLGDDLGRLVVSVDLSTSPLLYSSPARALRFESGATHVTDPWSYGDWQPAATPGEVWGIRWTVRRGLGLQVTCFTHPFSCLVVYLPFSYLTVLAALPPALWLRAWRRRRTRRARGFPVGPSPSEPRPSGSGSAPPPAR